MVGKNYRVKSRLVFLCFFGIMLCLIYRLFSIQVLGHDNYSYKAKGMHQIEIPLEPKRGEILDRNGHKLAMSVPMPSVYVNPKEVENPQDTADKLAKVLDKSKDFIYGRLTRDKRFVWIQRKVTIEQKEEISDLDISGIHFLEEPKRFYPKGELAVHVLGFVDIDNNGMDGVELVFDKYLKGKSGVRLTEKDAVGREVLTWRSKEVPAVEGFSLTLTIDEVIQYIVEEELDKGMDKYNSQSGMVMVMDPFTGEILALANRPNYDPNKYNKAKKEQMRNRAVTDCFEPGSIFKMFVAGAVLNERLFRLNDNIFCENGAYRVPGGVLHDHRPHANLTFQQVIEKSSNIGMAKVGQEMGQTDLYAYIREFGFGKATDVALPGEIEGILHPPSRWSRMSITRIPMGHEIAATTIQLTVAACAVANGGKLVKPRIVKRINDNLGRIVEEYKTKIVRDIINPDAAKKLKTALTGVVSSEGTAVRASLSDFNVAGKTGTAQKINPNGTYSHSDFVASFIGFVPAEKPCLVITVVLDAPKPVYYGGSTAAPIFKNIAKKTLAYLNVEPESYIGRELVAKK